jgi:hypothetical protein
VKLLDAAANPGGLSAGWRTKEGRAVEAGATLAHPAAPRCLRCERKHVSTPPTLELECNALPASTG